MKSLIAIVATSLMLISCGTETVSNSDEGNKDNSLDSIIDIDTNQVIEDTTINSAYTTMTSDEKNEMLTRINSVRQTGTTCNGTAMPPVPPLSWNSQLEAAAQGHSDDMVTQDYFSHTSLDGRSPGDRITETGYEYTRWAENIAGGYNSVYDVVNGWLSSEGHCRNIMNANVTEMATAKSNSLWTQVFATPR